MNAPLSEPALALSLLRQAAKRGRLIAVLRGAGRLDRVARLAALLADKAEVIALPPPDVLPYDFVPPSPRVIGRRVRALTQLARPSERPRLLLTSATAALIRVRPAIVWQEAVMRLSLGDSIEEEALRDALAQRAYRWDERVDEPGEAAFRGQVIDLFPAGDRQPVRLQLESGRIAGIVRVDPVTLRSLESLDQVELRPATEYRIDAEEIDIARARLETDADPEAPAPEFKLPRRLVPLFDLLPDAACYLDPEVSERWRSVRDAVDDAFDAARKAGRLTGEADELPPPDLLFLSAEAAEAAATDRIGTLRAIGTPIEPPRRVDDLLDQIKQAGRDRVVVATPTEPDSVAASLKRRGVAAEIVQGWADLAPGKVGVLAAELETGLHAPGLMLLPIGRLVRPKADPLLAGDNDAPRTGETVVHRDHGLCRLKALREIDGEDRLALEFADGVELLVPAEALDRIWRYGEGGTLDRLGGEGWRARREEIGAELEAVAARLAAESAARQAATAPVLRPEPERFAQVARRFPYPLSRDQRVAVHDVMTDLASGRPMRRLLCGDVGFGKTEIALRGAAAAAFAGMQVVIAAPTTILARQHLDSFGARFAGTGIRLGSLIRAADAKTKRAAARGEIDILIGTQGLTRITLSRPGLVVIDEEQRFGEADKTSLAALAPHLLAMTATPIPRTMQEALVGLRDVSVLRTPPQDRQPTRTFVLPWDPVVVREALLRERRRGGQSFIVCPRIADLAPLTARLAEIAPELHIVSAHGRMKPETLEAAVLGFAEGRGDVLLATNIIEAGLDIPRANLILVTQADRFGLAQLHQLRGRVGRGTRRGAAYFLTEPGRRLAPGTERRLATMETLTGLGVGIAVSSADLDLRGAGDLFGERQAGHLRAVGTELYQHLLTETLARQRGDPPPPPAAELHVGLTGCIPEAYVPEENLRIELLSRLARTDTARALRELAREFVDRFGPLPEPASALLSLQRLRIACHALRIARVDAGSRGIALTPESPDELSALAGATGGSESGTRVLLPGDLNVHARMEALLALLTTTARDAK